MTLSPQLKHRIATLLERCTGRSLASASARSFARSVGWIGFSFLAARALGMVVPLFAARYLGKELFGEATLAITVGQFFSMFMLLGMNNAVVRYAAPRDCPREEVGASVLVTIGVTILCLAAIYGGGGELIATNFKFRSAIITGAVVFSLFATFYVLLTSILQGLHRFFERGVSELLAGFGVLFGLPLGIALFGRHFGSYVTATCVGFSAAAFYTLYHLHKSVGRPVFPSLKLLTEMTAYGLFSCLGNVGFILTFYIQPMILNKLLSASNVGLFRVYQTASITIAQSLAVIFNTVVFPKASASTNRTALWQVTWRLWALGAIPLGIMLTLSQIVLIPIAGAEYPLHPELIAVFAVTSLVITIQATVGQFLAAEGVRGVAAGLIISIITGVLCVATTYVFVPQLGLMGACDALFVSYAVALLLVVVVENALLRTRVTPHEKGTVESLGPFESPSASEITPQAASMPSDD